MKKITTIKDTDFIPIGSSFKYKGENEYSYFGIFESIAGKLFIELDKDYAKIDGDE